MNDLTDKYSLPKGADDANARRLLEYISRELLPPRDYVALTNQSRNALLLFVTLLSTMSSEIQLLLRTLFTLRESLDPATEILQDPSSKAFHQALKRWTDESFEVPGAIIFPSGEDDAIFIVRSLMPRSRQVLTGT